MKPYVIASPDLVGNNILSGGIRVMWGLFGWLLARGQLVWMNRYPNEDFIAIYPEIYHGNPFNAKKVVRYILNKPGVMGGRDQNGNFTPGPTAFSPTDKLYYFSKLYGKAENEDHYMFLPILNLHIFKDQKKKRNKTCFFVGKGINTKVHPDNAIEITRNISIDQQILSNVLNMCHTMYGYEGHTAMYEIARLCGCRVKIISDYYTKDQFRLYEPGMNGISCGINEDVSLEVEGFRNHYKGLVMLFSKKLHSFIEETQND